MKKVVLLTALAVIFCISSAGCTKKEHKADNETYQIVWYQCGPLTRDNDVVFEEVSKYTKEKINATVTSIPIQYSSYAEKMKMIISTNENFDLCFISGNNFVTHASNSAFLPLDDLLKSNGKDILESVPSLYFEAAKINGKILACPTLKDIAHEFVLRYKKTFADKYSMDLSVVKKLEDMQPFLQKIKENEPDVYPMVYRGNGSLKRYLPFEEIDGCAIGAFRINDYDKIINQYDTDDFRAFFKTMRDWYQKGYVRKDAATAVSDEDIYKAGNYFSGGAESLPYQEIEVNLTRREDEKEVYLHISEPRLFTNDITGSMQAISRTSGNPEATMDFLNLLYKDEYLLNLIVHGIEGKHYIKTSGNHFKYPDGVTTLKDNDYFGQAYAQGNRFLLKTLDGTPDDIWDAYREFNDSAIKSQALGFVFDASNVRAEVAAIQNVYQEYMTSLLVGAVDPDEYLPKALDKFKLAGSDKVLAEMQRQYDEWRIK